MSKNKFLFIAACLTVVVIAAHIYNRPPELTQEELEQQKLIASWGLAHQQSVEADKCKSANASSLPECTPTKLTTSNQPTTINAAQETPAQPEVQNTPAAPVIANYQDQTPTQNEDIKNPEPVEEISKFTPSENVIYLNMGWYTLAFVVDSKISNKHLVELSKMKDFQIQSELATQALKSQEQRERILTWTPVNAFVTCSSALESCTKNKRFELKANDLTAADEVIVGSNIQALLHRGQSAQLSTTATTHKVLQSYLLAN